MSIKSKAAKYSAMLTVAASYMVTNPMMALAGDEKESGAAKEGAGAADFLNGSGVSGGEASKAFDKINQTTKAAGSSLFSWLITIAIIAGGIGIIVAAVKLGGNEKSRNDAKVKILYVLGGIAIAGGAISIINMVFGLGASAFS